ncbi:hypothetical protein [Planctellipticum variicoloris]|uniref:hypothetical protein n=1 Tax=Planctellipticum variicoloris TaxID=3064265 RepID=UPI0030133CFC|nr:hypothetical protein SH412_004252 [Planctomycetaceae bacterium SH412]
MRCVAGFLLTLLSLLPCAAADAPGFRWQRDVSLPEITETTAVAVPLDEPFYAATRDRWPDVRLYDSKGNIVSFLIQPAMGTKTRTDRHSWAAEQTAARVEPEGGLVVELALREKEPQPTGLRIVTPLRDFEHQVRVESSADGTTWVSAGPPGVIFDYSRFVDARNDTVPFTAGDHRRFRFSITDVTAEQESQLLELHRRLQGGAETNRTERTTIARRPFRVDRVEFYRDEVRAQATEPRLDTYEPARFTQTEDEKEHRTLVAIEAGRQPITALRVKTDDKNFSRSVRVEADVDSDAVHHVQMTGALTCFAVGSLQKEELTLKLPEGRWNRYEVAIENGDNPPLAIRGVELSGPRYELIFLATDGEKYRLEYGSPDAEPGRFDTAALSAVLREGPPKVAGALAEARENLSAPLARWRPWNDPNVLISGIVLLTLLLGWGLWRAGRRLDVAGMERGEKEK